METKISHKGLTETNISIKITGSTLLLLFGIYCFMSNPTKNMHISGNKKGTLIYNGVTAFWVTFLNPLIIFLFMVLFAQFSFVIPDHPLEMSINHNKQDYRVSRHNHFTDYTYRHSLQSLYIPLLTAVALTAKQKTPEHDAYLL